MNWRAIGRGDCGKSAVLCTALAAFAWGCGPSQSGSSSVYTETEGGSDSNRAFGGTPPLGNPPAIDATAPAADYLIEVSTLIQPAWRSFLEDCRIRLAPDHELNDPKLLARMQLTINGQGAVLSVQTVQSSGNEDFDAVALEILGDLKKLPAPPPEWISDDDRVRIGWKFARDIRQAGSSGGSIERVNLPLQEALDRFLEAGQIDRASRRLLDAGGRAVPVKQLDTVVHRIVELALTEEASESKAMALGLVASAGLNEFAQHVRANLDSSDLEVASAAVLALGRVGDAGDIGRLEEITNGTRQGSASYIAHAAASLKLLGRGPQVSKAAVANLKSADPELRLAGLAVLAELANDDSVGALAKMLNGSGTRSREERMAAARALGRQAPRNKLALRALLRGSNTADAALRASCVEAIASAAKAGLRSPLAYRNVLTLLRTKDERVRAAAIAAAAALAPARFSRELSSIRAGGSQLVVMSIARVLGDLPGSISLTRLLDLARVPNVGMRVAAARGLLGRQEEEARFALQDLLADPAPRVRAAALGSVQGEKALTTFLKDPAEEVRMAALTALVVELGKAKTAKTVAIQLSAADASRATQVQWAKAWLAAGR